MIYEAAFLPRDDVQAMQVEVSWTKQAKRGEQRSSPVINDCASLLFLKIAFLLLLLMKSLEVHQEDNENV